MKQHRTLSVAFVAALAFTLSACGGDDDPEPTTTAPAAPTEDPGDVDESYEDTGDATAEADQTAALPGQDDDADTAGAEDAQDTEDDEAQDTGDAGTGDDDTGSAADGEVPALADIWPTALENARETESVTATLTGASDGEEMDVTMQGQLDDSNFQIDMTVDDASASIIADEGTFYINGDENFWDESAPGSEDEAQTFADRWIIAPPEMGVAESMSFSDLWSTFLADVPTDAEQLQTSSAELTELDGQEAYHYVVEDDGTEIWVSADGEDNILKVSTEDEGEEMELTATDWNDTDLVDPPSDAVTLEELMAEG